MKKPMLQHLARFYSIQEIASRRPTYERKFIRKIVCGHDSEFQKMFLERVRFEDKQKKKGGEQ